MFRVYKEGEEVKQKLEGSQDLNVEKDPKAARLAGHREEECCICIQHVISLWPAAGAAGIHHDQMVPILGASEVPPPLFSLLCILQTPSSSFQKLGHPNRRRPSTFWRRDAGVERIGRRNRSECDLSSIPVLFSLFYTQTGWSREATVRMTKKRKERERERVKWRKRGDPRNLRTWAGMRRSLFLSLSLHFLYFKREAGASGGNY